MVFRSTFGSPEKHLTRWKEFQLSVERQMAEDGPIHEIQDWGSKLPGAVARIAGEIHCSLFPWRSLPAEIERETAEVVLRLGGLLISHVIAAFRIMQKPEKIEDAEKLLRWILRNRKREFHLREMFRAHQSIFGEVAAMMPSVLLLQDHGYLRQVEREKKPGRPSDICEVNPQALDVGQA